MPMHLHRDDFFVDAAARRAATACAPLLRPARGARQVWLTAWTGNARALAFYPRRGDAVGGTTAFEFEGESHENRLFAKEL